MTSVQRPLLLFSCLWLASAAAWGQQVPDTTFNPPVANPAYKPGAGPAIFLDEAHSNFHTAAGRFRPFAELLRRDGYVVKPFAARFTPETLKAAKILVIANALHPDNEQRWSLPTPSAFTDEEIAAVSEWVRQGGALFLIADHMPFPGAAEKLAAAFGFTFYNGFAMKKRNPGKDIFTKGAGLHDNVITRGRDNGESIPFVRTFTGQAFRIPENASPLVTLDDRFFIRMPDVAWEFKDDTPSIPAKGMAQGAFTTYGNGRIVVFGEAAMFSAQRSGNNRAGMNAEDAGHNAQFLLNIIHWLDGILK